MEKQALLEARREEIRRERALVEAAVAEEYLDHEDTSNEKQSKKKQRKEERARLKALKASELRRKLEKVSSEGGLGSIGDEGESLEFHGRSPTVCAILHLLIGGCITMLMPTVDSPRPPRSRRRLGPLQTRCADGKTVLWW